MTQAAIQQALAALDRIPARNARERASLAKERSRLLGLLAKAWAPPGAVR